MLTSRKQMPSENISNSPGLERCTQCGKRILFWTLGGNIFLAVVKLSGGALSKSSGLFADGLESLACVFSNILIMGSMKVSGKGHDAKYPYGYGKIEFIAALVVFSLLLGLGFYIVITSLMDIFGGDLVSPGIIGLPFAVVSVFLTFMMYRYNICAGKKLNSAAMIANAYQTRADMYTSFTVALGVILSQLSPSLIIGDKLAALFVGLLILKDSFNHWMGNLDVILDKFPESDYSAKIISIVSEVFSGPQPQAIRLKRTGQKFWIGIPLHFPDTDNIEQMEAVTNRIREAILNRIYWAGEVDFFLDR